jgi:hypothetical protein
MAYHSDEFYDKAQPNYSKFISELTALSRKYGVAVYGHFDITTNLDEFKDLTYSKDISSSDIRAQNYWGE